MSLSIAELARAREATTGLLEELGLEAYLFEIQPRDELWEVKVDCAMRKDGQWESVSLRVPREILAGGDDGARRQLLAEWRERFAECRRQ